MLEVPDGAEVTRVDPCVTDMAKRLLETGLYGDDLGALISHGFMAWARAELLSWGERK
jgi:hypothetical protein